MRLLYIFRSEQYQNEQHTIAAISSDFRTLTLNNSLRYNHLFVNETVEGVPILATAEVGLLTRNVKIMGNINEEWTEFIPGCDRPFKAGA